MATPDPPPRLGGRSILAVIVLYEMAPQNSPALTSLVALSPEQRQQFVICVFDNSTNQAADPQVGRLGVDHYVWTSRNSGLAPHYQSALNRAEKEGAEWLLLLDQDTLVTGEYIKEVLGLVAGGRGPIDCAAAVVPRLIANGRQVSPHRPVRVLTRPVDKSGLHQASEGCQFLNSGAVLRVSALRGAGGFPQQYPLDYLDHAMCARLRRRGGDVFVLDSRLTHDLSLMNRAQVPVDRLRSLARAEERYVAEYGAPHDRLLLVLKRALFVGALIAGKRETPSLREDLASLWRSVRGVVAVRQPPQG